MIALRILLLVLELMFFPFPPVIGGDNSYKVKKIVYVVLQLIESEF